MGTSDSDNLNSLSKTQRKILSFIEEALSLEGTPPTYREIASHFGYSAVGTVQDHVRALLKKGFLRTTPGRARGLTLSHRMESLDIPVLGAVPAGRPIEAIEDRRGSLSFSLSSAGLSPKSQASAEIYALRVKGESMRDAGILDGDFVIVRKQHHAENGQIIIALIEGEATVKFLEKRSDRIRLLPANPAFSPIDVPVDAENLVQGKVIGVQRFY